MLADTCNMAHIKMQRSMLVVFAIATICQSQDGIRTILDGRMCDFDDDVNWMCGLSENMVYGNMRWIRQHGKTPSGNTGPMTDHTTGNGHYLYMEASNQQPGDMAVLDISLPQRVPYCLRFYYYMFGQHTGSLSVEVYDGDDDDTVFEEEELDEPRWYFAEVDLPFDAVVARIIAERGGDEMGQPFGDIAIDDIQLSRGDCSGIPLPIEPPVGPPSGPPVGPPTQPPVGPPSATCDDDEEFKCGTCVQSCTDPRPLCVSACSNGCHCPDDRPVTLSQGRCGYLADCFAVECPVDLLVLFDGTSADDDDDYREEFVEHLVDSVRINSQNVQIEVHQFASDFKSDLFFEPDGQTREEVMDKIDDDRFDFDAMDGTANLTEALSVGAAILMFEQSNGHRRLMPGIKKMMIVVSHSYWRPSDKLTRAITTLRDQDIHVISMGVTRAVNQQVLQSIVTDPMKYHFSYNDFSQLDRDLHKIVESICSEEQSVTLPMPEPPGSIVAFSVSASSELFATPSGRVLFNYIHSNVGAYFEPLFGVFTCPAKGLYFFSTTWFGVTSDIASVIMHSSNEDQMNHRRSLTFPVHPHAHVDAVFVCDTGEAVWVEIVSGEHQQNYFDSEIGFVGYLINKM